MVGYYYYLWSTTWPNLIVLLLIWGIVLLRLGWKFVGTWRYARDAWGFLLLAGKTLIWVVVLGIYTNLLFFSQPDWLFQPGFMQGSVQGKAIDSGSRFYLLDVRNGTEQKQFYIDQNVYEQLKLEDQVKLMYLPSRLEVVRCELVGSLR
ncbi:hypothetical protein [Desulfosporosinus metallidurans]|uniref:Uncharacterized protein n=1 Tax=Desulfosporosinus metallidurans TaxID=1888891 RepID=A0A1Q8R1V5_9FIRM|nr:hypothetical protein [Desulfosporosinus metallidurans]OLN33471.1 hypothetical protein DSOL_0718 [Desulfosporosinus metallidurans]